MRPFLIDNTRIDGKVYWADDQCVVCGLSLWSKSFYKDMKLGGMPYYFQALNVEMKSERSPNSVMFCGPQHSSDWHLANKDKIWDRKN